MKGFLNIKYSIINMHDNFICSRFFKTKEYICVTIATQMLYIFSITYFTKKGI